MDQIFRKIGHNFNLIPKMWPSIQAEQMGVNVLQPKLTDAQRTAGVGNKLSRVTKRRMGVEAHWRMSRPETSCLKVT